MQNAVGQKNSDNRYRAQNREEANWVSLERHFLQDVNKDLSNVQNEETFERHVEM